MPFAFKEREQEYKRDYNKEWKENNPEKVKAQRARHYEKHKDEMQARVKEWKAKNPDKVSESKARYKAKKNLIAREQRYVDTTILYVKCLFDERLQRASLQELGRILSAEY